MNDKSVIVKKNILPALIICSSAILTFLIGVGVSAIKETVQPTAFEVAPVPSKLKTDNEKLAWIYGADSKKISEHDCKSADRLMEAVGEWNVESAEIVRDFLDQNVSAEDFLITSTRQVPKLSAVVYRMNVEIGLIENKGVLKTLAPTIPIHEEGLSLYRELHKAVAEGDQSRQVEVSQKIRKFGERKRTEFMPLVRRIQQVVSANDFDKAMSQFQEEVAGRLRSDR